MNKRISKSLRMQLLCIALLSVAVAALVFFGAFSIGNIFLDKTVYGHAFEEAMADQQFDKLQDFVEEESVSQNQLQKLDVWCSRGEKVYLTVYRGDTLIYNSHGSRTAGGFKSSNYDPDKENPDSEYSLLLQDGTRVRAFLYYYAGDAFYFWMALSSVFFAFLAFSICFIGMVNRKVSYIKRLKQELDILSGGQLEYEVTVAGSDELAELASGIDQMRRSIRNHQEIEDQIKSANSELITAMSHDLRTPLTSLLAYLEIIERKKYTDEAQLHTLIKKSLSQTLRIKNMADKMFEYFLAYATEWENSERIPMDSDQLFGQIIEDYAGSLQENGFRAETEFTPAGVQIEVDLELLQRAMDNLYSNLLKYADPEQPVQLCCRAENGCILITLKNGILKKVTTQESTKIGLNTCRRIISYHGGDFSAEEENGTFSVRITLPFLLPC